MADTSYKLINEEILTDIADAIREKSDVSTTYYPHEMPDAIRGIETGEDLNLTVATVTSTEASQTVTPTQGYNGFSRVNVNPIPSQYKKLTTTTTATAENILNGKTVYNNNGQLVTGSMANNGSTSGTISTKEGTVTIPSGYTSGGTVSINSSEKAKIIDSNIKSGVTILGVSGKSSVVDTANSNAVAENILANKTAFVNGTKVTGSMPNNGATGGTISTKTGTVTIPAGHTTGGTVSISTTEQEKIVAGNIKEGVTILGVTGTASGGSTPVLQEKTATPDTTTQQIRPDDNYDGLSKVTVNPIPSQYKPLTTTTTATAGNILNTKTAYNSDGQLITGSMANNGATGGTINTKTGTVTIPEGYTSGGNVSISSAEQAKIIADNIKQGVTILGVTGTASGGGTPVLQTKTVKSSTEQDETYTPETGYDGFSSVTVQKFNLQTKSVNPGTSEKIVTADTSQGYDGLKQVNVRGVPLQTDKTVTLTSAIETIRPDTGYSAMTSVGITAPLQDITITPQDHQQSIIPPSSNYIGYGNITVSAAKLQEKSVTPQMNQQIVQPDTSQDYIGLSSVTITGDSDLQAGNIKKDVEIFGVTGTYEPALQDKTVTPTTLQQIITADNGYDGLGTVTVNAASGSANIQSNKNATAGSTAVEVTPDQGYDGMAKVTISALNYDTCWIKSASDEDGTVVITPTNCDAFDYVIAEPWALQEKTVTPSATQQVITADSPTYDALKSVTVSGDANLVAGNIVNGVTIFGVTGTASSGTDNLPDILFGEISYLSSNILTINKPSGSNGAISGFTYGYNLSFPDATSIAANAFRYSGIRYINAPNVTTIGQNAFIYSQLGVQNAYDTNPSYNSVPSFPLCTSIDNYAFQYTNIKNINLPECTSIGTSCFANNPAFGSNDPVNLPKIQTVGRTAFNSCINMTSLTLGKCTSIDTQAFKDTYLLNDLYLPNDTMVSLANTNAFNNAGSRTTNGKTTVHVPQSLLTTYQSDTNWSAANVLWEAIT